MLWEILVPTEKRVKTEKPKDGDSAALRKWEKKNSFKARYHRVWDEKVRGIAGGLTILAPVKGQWVSSDKVLFKERMIPVRIVCSREEIEKIIDMTLEHYDQLAVLCYRISDEVILRERT